MFAASRLLLAVAVLAVVVQAGGAGAQHANSFTSNKADFTGKRAHGAYYTTAPRLANDSDALSSTLPPAPSSRRTRGALTVGFMSVATLFLLVSYLLIQCCAAFSGDHDVDFADGGAGPESLEISVEQRAGKSRGL
ncbi:hypothetical protein ACSSS7_002981 [Eimeria intestinalis]